MVIYDISMSISGDMPVYAGNTSKKPRLKTECYFEDGGVYETRMEINMHTGTHIDAPLHMIENGGTIDRLDLQKVMTKCKVFDFTDVSDKISQEHLAGKDIAEGDFILFKTKNSFEDILEGNFIYLDKDGAEYLSSKKILGVGTDALGIERGQPGHETHKILFGAGIVILEGLRLKDIDEGEYFLAAAPVRVMGAEAAPVRALLIK